MLHYCRGSEFRKEYAKLGAFCAIFPDSPGIVITATASYTDMSFIQESLGLKKCKLVVAHPDRTNIYYDKVFRHGDDAVESILTPVAQGLFDAKVDYPLTVIYVSLKLCGFAYRLFEYILGIEQYFPVDSAQVPSNRLFAQFHGPQTKQTIEEILKQLCSKKSTVRVVFSTVAMGVDMPNIRQVIHIGPPCNVKACFQETGHAGRDGNLQELFCIITTEILPKTELEHRMI